MILLNIIIVVTERGTMFVHITKKENLEKILESGLQAYNTSERTEDINYMLWQAIEFLYDETESLYDEIESLDYEIESLDYEIESLDYERGNNIYTTAMNNRAKALYFFQEYEDNDYSLINCSSDEIKIAVDEESLDLNKLYVADMAIVDYIDKYIMSNTADENLEAICNIMKSYLGSMNLYMECDSSNFEIPEYLYIDNIPPDKIIVIK